MNINSRVGRILSIISLSLVTAILANLPAHAQSTLEKIKNEGAIRVGFANEAPFGYATTSGVLTGEAPETARVILSNIGDIKLEGVLTEFGSLIPGLQAGRFDMIAAGMFIRPNRCEQINFSNPTYGIGQAFLVRAGNPRGLHSYEDVAGNEDAKLAVVAGGVERDYARDANIPDDRVTVLPDFPTATAAVQTGRVDALALTSLSIQNIVDTADDPNLERASPFTDPPGVRGFGGFGFRKDAPDLLEAFNAGLSDFIGSPEHIEMMQGFGFTQAELPGEVTAEQLCSGS